VRILFVSVMMMIMMMMMTRHTIKEREQNFL